MISRRITIVAAAVAIAGAGIVATAVLSSGASGSGDFDPVEHAPLSTTPATSGAPPGETSPATVLRHRPTTTTRPRSTTSRPRPPVTTSIGTSSTTVPGPTIAPPSTYSADIDVLAPRRVAAPVGVLVPTVGIDANVVPTGVDEHAELAVPADALTLVWYQYGPSPGQPGSAVIAGHFDWEGVPGAFHELARTPVGEQITITYADRSQRAFTVTNVELVDKPAVAVNGTFARDGASTLRLVTCGGEFNDDVSSYYSNVVVTAEPA